MTVKESVLQALQENKGEYLSGEKLSEELGVSRAAVWKAIKAIREEGYRVDAVTNRGYLLQNEKAVLSAEEIRRFLPARYRDRQIYVYDVIDSTNTRARQIAVGAALPDDPLRGNAPARGNNATRGSDPAHGDNATQSSAVSNAAPAQLHGTTVVALQQTAGKGRMGRSFFSPKEGIYLSIIIKPDFDLSRSVLVTVATAAAVAEAIDEVCGQTEKTQIKWVNDVYLKGGKVCGILTEGITDFETGQIDHLVIGIGINTTLEGFPEELRQIAGAVEGDYSKPALAAGVIWRVLDYMDHIQQRRFMKSYREKSFLIGRDIRVYKGVYRSDPAKELDGIPARVLDIDEDGGLQVIYTDGRQETLTTGEVSIRT